MLFAAEVGQCFGFSLTHTAKTHISSSHNTLVNGAQPSDIIHMEPIHDITMC
jgi:hypothetical protein